MTYRARICIVIIHAISCLCGHIFDDTLVVFSQDRREKVLLDRGLVEGFTARQDTYHEDMQDGERKKWLVQRVHADLSISQMVTVPNEHVPYINDFFSMASIPEYAEGKLFSMQGLVGILWGWLYFHLREFTTVSPKYARGRAEMGKRSCFLQNLFFLLKNNPNLKKEVRSILAEIEKLPENTEEVPPTGKFIPRDRLLWFLRHSRNADIREFLDVYLYREHFGVSVRAETVGDVKKRNTVKISVFKPEKTKSTPGNLDFTEFLHRHSLSSVRKIDLFIGKDISLPEPIFQALFVLFSGARVLSYEYPGEKYVKKSADLIADLLRSEKKRINQGHPPLLNGLILSSSLLLSETGMHYLEKSSLEVFGFKSFYPPTPESEFAFKKAQPALERCLDRIFEGRTLLSTTLEHIVGPESLFFLEKSRASHLPRLKTAEIHMPHSLAEETGRFYRGILTSLRQARKVIVSGSSKSTPKDTLRILSGISRLQNISVLDLSKASLGSLSLSEILQDVRTQYRHSLHTLKFVYPMESSLSRESPIISSLSRALPNISKYNVFVTPKNQASILPVLIKDLHRTLTGHKRRKRLNLSMTLHLLESKSSGSSPWKTLKSLPYKIDESSVSRAYSLQGLSESAFTQEEMHRLLFLSTHS
ncbi:uncharacterized protein NEMAJ01_2175 [Nematocida major]|uniref:uncharacterized protein n=1 Tax=Nematocida major TaxID=1912982 RepID=UPI002007760F|nr:uncharacterized protein NEMAJ01_2175 [Nematocida major]KAH9387279.1 hypothetical protein NEMAJ01_2175 [Nematocida major]